MSKGWVFRLTTPPTKYWDSSRMTTQRQSVLLGDIHLAKLRILRHLPCEFYRQNLDYLSNRGLSPQMGCHFLQPEPNRICPAKRMARTYTQKPPHSDAYTIQIVKRITHRACLARHPAPACLDHRSENGKLFHEGWLLLFLHEYALQ